MMGSQHPSPNAKILCNFEPQIWPEIITLRDAESTCFEGRTSSDLTILGFFGPNFGRKRSHHVIRKRQFVHKNLAFTIFVPINPPSQPAKWGISSWILLEAPQTELRTLGQNCEETLQKYRTNRIILVGISAPKKKNFAAPPKFPADTLLAPHLGEPPPPGLGFSFKKNQPPPLPGASDTPFPSPERKKKIRNVHQVMNKRAFLSDGCFLPNTSGGRKFITKKWCWCRFSGVHPLKTLTSLKKWG